MSRDGFSTSVGGTDKNVVTRAETTSEYEGIKFIVEVARKKTGDKDFLVVWGKGDNSLVGPSGSQFRVKSSGSDELAHWVEDASSDKQTLTVTLQITYDPNQTAPNDRYVVTPGDNPEP